MLKISFKKCTQYFNPCPLRYNVLSFEIYHPEAENLAIFCYYFDVYNPINDSEDLNFNENHLSIFATETIIEKLETKEYRNFKKFAKIYKFKHKEWLLDNFLFYLTEIINPGMIISWKQHQFDFSYLIKLVEEYLSSEKLCIIKAFSYGIQRYYARRMILSGRRFQSFSYFMNEFFKKAVPRVSDLSYLLTSKMFTYFLTKVLCYSKKSCEPILKMIELSSLCNTCVQESQGGNMYCIEGCLFPKVLADGLLPFEKSPFQITHQDATEWIPCCMEPEAGLYRDAISVLDFQSLYPSLICAFGLDYGSFLGTLEGGAVSVLFLDPLNIINV